MQHELVETEAVLVLTNGIVNPNEVEGRLRDLGYYDGPRESSPWRETLAALTRFQRDRGLAVTGCPDAATMAALRESYCY